MYCAWVECKIKVTSKEKKNLLPRVVSHRWIQVEKAKKLKFDVETQTKILPLLSSFALI